MKITYQNKGDYLIPNLTLPEDTKVYSFGKYAHLRKKYLEEYRRVIFVNLLTSCKLNQHLAEIEQEAFDRIDELVKAMAKADGADEQLKATNQMEWVRFQNNYRSCVEEIILKELVYV